MIMNLYAAYLDEIESRKKQNLKPKPIDNGPMVEQLIKQILDKENEYRDESINFFIYNIIPGTTSAAKVKAKFLKEIVLAEVIVDEITPSFALELLSHMKVGIKFCFCITLKYIFCNCIPFIIGLFEPVCVSFI